MSFGFLATNRSSAEVLLPAPFSTILGVGKSSGVVVEDPATVENNATIKSYLNANIISLSTFPVVVTTPPPPPPFVLVPGPPGPQGSPGVPGSSSADTGIFTCLAGLAVKDIVYASSSDSVDKASATSLSTIPAIGFCLQKNSATQAVIQYSGEMPGFIGLTPNMIYYVSTVPGAITTTAPTTAGQIVQKAGLAKDATTLIVDVDKDFVVLT